jgi:C4-dicarboxylate-specific signal transduction histidine kinase
MDQAAARKAGLEIEHRIVMPDGSIKHVRVVGRPMENHLQLVGAVTDITETRRAEVERRRAEEALRTTEAELAHAARLMTMGELSASIAHEVNQPLAAILLNGKACLRWLAADPPDHAEARMAVQRVVDDAVRAGEVIGRIRALTCKTTEAEMGPLDLNETIDQVQVIARSELQRARVAFRTRLQEDLPLVIGDRIQVQQLLLNLVINAMEAMSMLSDRPRELLVATGENGAGKVLVEVKDSGVGVDPRSRGRLFDAFYTTKPTGMGMGLSISRSIVQSHGGELWVEANAGPGATFRFTLPKAGAAASRPPRADPF